MTTVVNTPPSSGDNGNSGIIIGVVILLIVLFLLFFFGAPFLRGNRTAPAPQSGGVQVPSQIDVNVNKAPQPS